MINKIFRYFNAVITPFFFKLGCMLLLTIFLNGCTTIHLPKYDAQPFDHYQYSQAKGGLAVAIHPLTNKKEVNKYFGTDLISAGILPIFVIAKNQGSSSSFILLKDKLSLEGGQRAAKGVSDLDQFGSESGGAAVGLVGAAIANPLLIVFGAKMQSDGAEIKHNLAVKELRAKTLSPGEITHGFVYLRLPEKHELHDQWTVHLELIDLRSKDSKSFNLPFEWERD